MRIFRFEEREQRCSLFACGAIGATASAGAIAKGHKQIMTLFDAVTVSAKGIGEGDTLAVKRGC